MKHREWLGQKDLIEKLLKKAGLEDTKEAGNRKKAMRCIILSKYVEYMTIEETLAKLSVKYGIESSTTAYYRLFNEALRLMEENRQKIGKKTITILGRKII